LIWALTTGTGQAILGLFGSYRPEGGLGDHHVVIVPVKRSSDMAMFLAFASEWCFGIKCPVG
jgi:hypothetical protein